MGEKSSDKLDPKIVKKTQDTLGKIIKKPPLTDKLLSKPPFRFLHDIMTSTIKTSGFMKGLFTENEMNSENVKDKDSKIAFLQKAFDLVALVNGKPLSVRPTKVVAGHEPEKTNDFLQCLAMAVSKKVNNKEYVDRVLNGETLVTSKKSGSAKKEREHSSDRRKREVADEKRQASGDRDDGRTDGARREKSHDRTRTDRRSSHGERGGEKAGEKGEKGDRTEKAEDKERHRERKKRKEKEEVKETAGKDSETGGGRRGGERKGHHEEMMNGEGDPAEREEAPAARMPRPASAKGSRRRHGHDEELQRQQQQQHGDRENATVSAGDGGAANEEDVVPPQVTATRKLIRPSSARPAPPKPKKEATVDESAIMCNNVPNLIVDKERESEDDGDDGFVTKEDEDLLAAAEETKPLAPSASQTEEDTGEHGGLVKNLLESKKELEGANQQTSQKKTEIERPTELNDVSRRRERELAEKEVEKLRASIQTLARSVNPLGKVIDYLQEDLDAMNKELLMWNEENRVNAVSLQRERGITDDTIEPLRGQLTDLDRSIADQLDLIAAVKSNTLRNDERIERMLQSVAKS